MTLDYNGKPVRKYTGIISLLGKILLVALICILALKIVLVFTAQIYVFDYFDTVVFFVIYFFLKYKTTF